MTSPTLRRPIALASAVLVPFALTACSHDTAGTTSSTATSSTATSTTSPSVVATSPAASAAAAGASGSGTCSYPTEGQAAKRASAPATSGVATTGTAVATLHMAAGDVKLTLNRQAAPCTVNSFVSLAQQGYFNATKCHRLTTEGLYVLQCGDPSATGSGGPGYRFNDELTGHETYPAGTVAMANAGANTNGSQFFLVYKDTQLQPNYTVFGHLDPASLAVVQKIAAKGSNPDGDGVPIADAGITSVTLG